jgi:hypothetical protein
MIRQMRKIIDPLAGTHCANISGGRILSRLAGSTE